MGAASGEKKSAKNFERTIAIGFGSDTFRGVGSSESTQAALDYLPQSRAVFVFLLPCFAAPLILFRQLFAGYPAAKVVEL
jgi:hypothetical protein